MENRRQIFGCEVFKDVLFKDNLNVGFYKEISLLDNKTLSGYIDKDLKILLEDIFNHINSPIFDLSEYNFEVQGKYETYILTTGHININYDIEENKYEISITSKLKKR